MQEKEGKGWISEKEEEDANMETTIDIVYKNLFYSGNAEWLSERRLRKTTERKPIQDRSAEGGIEMAGRSNQSTGDGEGGCCTHLTYISQGGRERGEGDGDISPIRRIYSPTWLM